MDIVFSFLVPVRLGNHLSISLLYSCLSSINNEKCLYCVDAISKNCIYPSRCVPHCAHEVEESDCTSISACGVTAKVGLSALCQISGRFCTAGSADLTDEQPVPRVLDGPFPDRFFNLKHPLYMVHTSRAVETYLEERTYQHHDVALASTRGRAKHSWKCTVHPEIESVENEFPLHIRRSTVGRRKGSVECPHECRVSTASLPASRTEHSSWTRNLFCAEAPRKLASSS